MTDYYFYCDNCNNKVRIIVKVRQKIDTSNGYTDEYKAEWCLQCINNYKEEKES